MICPTIQPVAMNELDLPTERSATDWLWHGIIARGNLTLLTSRWKAGKTTLLTGLLQQFEKGGTFLDRAVARAKVLVVSEESRATWTDRLRRMPVGPHSQLLSRPFPRRPTPEQWKELIDRAEAMRAGGQLDLMVVDPLAKFLPGSTDSDMSTILEFLDPLQRLAASGVGVTVLHHPRKKPSEPGSSARGTGGLLAAVDIIVELLRYGQLRSDESRRKLFCLSRYPETPRNLVYQWDVSTGLFTSLGDPLSVRFNENWALVHAILEKRTKAATPKELLEDWPTDREPPSLSVFYEWLNRATEEKRVRRLGAGRRANPYRYRLENEDDQYNDRGEIPPLPDLYETFRDRG